MQELDTIAAEMWRHLSNLSRIFNKWPVFWQRWKIGFKAMLDFWMWLFIFDRYPHSWAVLTCAKYERAEFYMMTSSNGNILHVTGPVGGEFTGDRSQRPVTQSFDVFFDWRLNKRLNKQSWDWWFETPSCPLWRHSIDIKFCDIINIHNGEINEQSFSNPYPLPTSSLSNERVTFRWINARKT